MKRIRDYGALPQHIKSMASVQTGTESRINRFSTQVEMELAK
jgi:hypothetical protein